MTRARLKSEDRARASVYYVKAQRFAASARESLNASRPDPAAANAINAVINLVDSLCVHYRGQRNGGESHHAALDLLRAVTEIEPQSRAQIEKHLTFLLSQKNLAQYEGRLVTTGEADDAVAHMERAFRAAEALAPVKIWSARR